MFFYKKIAKRKFIRTCDVCGGVKEVTFIHTKEDCNPISCGIDNINYNYLNKEFGDMKIIDIYKKERVYICKTICKICGLVSETRLNNMINNSYSNQNHKNCKTILYKQIDDLKKFQNFSERWRNIIKRCCNKNHKSYSIYKDIGISEEWMDFMNFYFDMYEGFEPNLQIDRIDGSKSYSKENCRWVTPLVNSMNRRTIKTAFSYNILEDKIIEFKQNSDISLRKYIEKVLNGSSTTVYDRLNGKTQNKKPYKNHMWFNTEKELKDYLSVETKCE